MTRRALLFILTFTSTLWIACGDDDTATEDAANDVVVKPACLDVGGPLTLSPEDPTVSVGGLLVLRATGGTGAYRFQILENASRGRIDDLTGVYVGGDRPTRDMKDLVELSDDGCTGNAYVDVTVVEGITLSPSTVEVRPAASVDFVTSGGSGSITLTLSTNRSGGSLAGRRYTAGSAAGQDVVRARDEVTGATADAMINVRSDAGLRATVPRVFLPVGSRMPVPLEGGSGEVTVTGAPGLTVSDGELVASDALNAMATFTDSFTGDTAQVRVTSTRALTAPAQFDHDRSNGHLAIEAGDIDGDGFNDVIIGRANASRRASRNGAVFIFRGTGSGIETEPARVIPGNSRSEAFGYAIEVADVDLDGLDDLIIGALNADTTRSDAGAVHIFRGVEGQLFEDSPSILFTGRNSGDRLGRSLTACDFNGDGMVDLALGAAEAEDLGRSPRENQQGAVYLYLNYGGEFAPRADAVIYGEIPDGAGGYTTHDNLRLGEWMTSGDIDGDGHCDLVATALRPHPTRGNDGAVFVYRGRPADGPDPGGLEATPAIAWAGMDEGNVSNQFGARLVVHDLDGDGMDDILVPQPLRDTMGAGDSGALYLFRGRALSGQATELLSPTTADWSYFGTRGSDQVGNSVAVADPDGDGEIEIIVTAPRAMGSEESELSRGGRVDVLEMAGTVPAMEPSMSYEGPEQEARFGSGLGSVGDIDDDGADELITFAPYYDALDFDAGGTFILGTPAPIMIPTERTSQRLGASTHVADLDGDGSLEMIVTATHGDRSNAVDVGYVHIYQNGPDGYDTAPSATYGDFPLHSASDEFGIDVKHADFDGDGRTDLLVLARTEDRPREWPETFTTDGSCDGAISNTGALWVFKGQASGLPATTPSLVAFGPQNGRGLRELAVLDVNGDGLDDAVVGSRDWNQPTGTSGGFAIYLGGALPDTGTTVRCNHNGTWTGIGGSQSAYRIEGIGDVDADGCDDWAVGAPLQAREGLSNEGGTHIFFGFNPSGGCARTSRPAPLTFWSGHANAQSGKELAGGGDVDGDGIPDLLVGGPDFRNGAGEVGRVYVLLGSRIRAAASAPGPHTLTDSVALELSGSDAGELLATGLTFVPGIGPGGTDGFAAGGTQAAINGESNTGGVRVHRFVSGAIEVTPYAIVAGERGSLLAGFGGRVSAGRTSAPVLLISSIFSDATNPDDGAAYAYPL